MDINCEVLLQELNKHLLFIYNNAIESYKFEIMNDIVINAIRVLAILFIIVFSITINAAVSTCILIIIIMSSALIQSLSSSLWFSLNLKHRYCLIMSSNWRRDCSLFLRWTIPSQRHIGYMAFVFWEAHLFLHNEEIMGQ